MTQLNGFELFILTALAERYPDVNQHIPYLGIYHRHYTVHGMYTDFEYKNGPQDLAFLEDESGRDCLGLNVLIIMNNSNEIIDDIYKEQTLGWHITVKEGRLYYMEFYTYGDQEWDCKMDVFQFAKTKF